MKEQAALDRPQINVPPEMYKRVQLEVFSSLAKALTVDHPKLEDYFKEAWPIIEPATTLEDAWYLGYLAEHLEAVSMGQLTRLAISIPPRLLKSSLVTILWPTWDWITYPWDRFMAVSYSQDLSTDHSIKRRRVIENSWYKEKWGSIYSLMPDQNRKNVFENTASGVMLATSAGGTATGKGANKIIFDDFINPKEAESETERKSKISDYSHTFSTRLNNAKKDALIIVAQRTHTNDLTGHVLKEGGWTHIELPYVATERQEYSFPLTGRIHVREVGDFLNPARQDAITLEKQKRASGSRAFSAQFMCKPSSDDGNMVKRFWWKFYCDDPHTLVDKMQVNGQSWDFAFKDLEEGSFVEGLIGGRLGSKKYIFGEVRDHMDFTQTCKAVITANANWPKTTYNFYEDRANGPAVKSALGGKVHGLVAVEPLGSKAARMSAASPDIEAGDVLLPYPYDDQGNPRPDRQWVLDFIEELARFPEEPNDRGDALSQLIIKLNSVILDDPDEPEFNDNSSIVNMNGEGQIPALDFGGIDMGGSDVGFY